MKSPLDDHGDMDLLPSLVLALARATGSSISVIKVQHGIRKDQMPCLDRKPCNTCDLCPGKDA